MTPRAVMRLSVDNAGRNDKELGSPNHEQKKKSWCCAWNSSASQKNLNVLNWIFEYYLMI